MADASIYTVGGTVQTNRQGIYIPRLADEELLALCREGKFAYVLTPRQMGKSSLMVRTAFQLRTEGIHSVMIDLTAIGTQVKNTEQWYLGLLIQVEAQLMLDTEVHEWWLAHEHLGFTQRLTEFFLRVLLVEIITPIVIFIDEIDTTLSLDFTDDFYAAIRYLYVSRAFSLEEGRLSFVLFGVATPGDLIRDSKRTPFNVGQRVDLTDFTLNEASPLAEGLGLPRDKAQQVLRWVLYWTGGHPYLSQRLCSIISQQSPTNWLKADIDDVVSSTFFGEMSEQDNNLQFVRDMLTKRAPEKAAVLTIYREIRRGKRPVADEEQSIIKSHLKLSGIVRREKGVLKIRNPIYRQVFDLKWVNQHLPLNLRDFWQRYKPAIPYVAGLLIFSIFMAGMALYANTERLSAEKSLANSEVLVQSLTTENLFASGFELDALLSGLEAGKKLKKYDQAVDPDNRTKAIVALQQVVYGLKEHNRLEGHSGPVYSVVFSPNGKTIASASDDKTVKLWNLSGQLLQTLRGHSGPVYSVVFSPDGKTIASASDDKTVKLWNLSGQLLQTLRGHSSGVNSVVFSPDGKTIATGSGDKTVKLWNLSGQPLQTLHGHSGYVYSIVFSPDGKTIASASSDKTVKLWNLSGQLLQTLRGHSSQVNSVVFSSDGKTIATGSDDNTMKLWNLSGQLLQTLRGHSGPIFRVVFSPDDKTIASASWDYTVKLWNLSGQLLQTLRGHSGYVYSIVFSPDGKTIASASYDKTVKLWNLSGQLLQTLRGHSGQVYSVMFSPDGKTIASASDDKTVKLWNLSGQLLQTLRGHSARVYSVVFSPDGKTIASASYDKTVKLWNLSGQLLQTLRGHSGQVYSVVFSPDGKTIASASYDKTVKLWNLSGELLQTLRGHSGQVYSVVFSPDGKTIASASYDKTVKLWNLSGELLQTLRGHSSYVNSVVFSPDGKTIASASYDKTVKLWNLSGQLLQTLHGHSGYVYSVVFSRDGKTIASASDDKTVKLWNLSGQLLQTLHGHSGYVYSVVFSRDGKTIATGSFDKTVKLWNLNLDDLLQHGCDWVHDYLKNNPNVKNDERQLCDDVAKKK